MPRPIDREITGFSTWKSPVQIGRGTRPDLRALDRRLLHLQEGWQRLEDLAAVESRDHLSRSGGKTGEVRHARSIAGSWVSLKRPGQVPRPIDREITGFSTWKSPVQIGRGTRPDLRALDRRLLHLQEGRERLEDPAAVESRDHLSRSGGKTGQVRHARSIAGSWVSLKRPGQVPRPIDREITGFSIWKSPVQIGRGTRPDLRARRTDPLSIAVALAAAIAVAIAYSDQPAR